MSFENWRVYHHNPTLLYQHPGNTQCACALSEPCWHQHPQPPPQHVHYVIMCVCQNKTQQCHLPTPVHFVCVCLIQAQRRYPPTPPRHPPHHIHSLRVQRAQRCVVVHEETLNHGALTLPSPWPCSFPQLAFSFPEARENPKPFYALKKLCAVWVEAHMPHACHNKRTHRAPDAPAPKTWDPF